LTAASSQSAAASKVPSGHASWAIGIVSVALANAILITARRRRQGFGFTVRPPGPKQVIAAPFRSDSSAQCWWSIPIRYRSAWCADCRPPPEPPRNTLARIAHGFAMPVLIAIAVGLAMTFSPIAPVSGRYVFAIAASGSRRTLRHLYQACPHQSFALMGLPRRHLCLHFTARCNRRPTPPARSTNSTRSPPAVMVHLADRRHRQIYGAMLGAVVMQSLHPAWAARVTRRSDIVVDWCWSPRLDRYHLSPPPEVRETSMDTYATKNAACRYAEHLHRLWRASSGGRRLVQLHEGEVVGLLGHNAPANRL